jgi:ubiquinone biosynthesis protein
MMSPARGLAQARRLLEIQRVLVRQGLDDLVAGTPLHPPVRRLMRWLPFRRGGDSADRPAAERLRQALVDLGPIFVKFGQTLSTRRDLLPEDVADELATLQDRVPPFPGDQALRMAEAAFGRPLAEVFAEFEATPIAAASIAQVHGATTRDGRRVIVKLLRPGVHADIRRDVGVLHTLARLAERYLPEARRFRPREVVEEFDRTLADELDLMREAANASQLRRNFEDSPLLYVPEVDWDLCRPGALVMERIDGINISRTEALSSAGVDLARLAAMGVEIFFTQVFRHNFFHADMHPGNIFVDASNPGTARYMAVDFGIVGSLDPRDQQYLAENFVAFFNRDYHRIARLHIDSGWVPASTRTDQLEGAFRTVCEPIFNRPLKDISFGQFLVRLFAAAQRFDMQVQPQLILLEKTLLNVEGLGRQLYPDLDLWATAKPILEEWMRARVSGRAVIDRLREQLPEVSESLQQAPQIVHGLLERAAEGRLEFATRNPDAARLAAAMEGNAARQRSLWGGSSALLAGVLWLGLDAGAAWVGWVAVLAGAALLAFGGRRKA